MPGKLGAKKVGDVIRHGKMLTRIERVVGDDAVVLQEMSRDSLGRLRSLGEDGRFSSTASFVRRRWQRIVRR